MSGFTSVAPNGPLYRVARTPDAWTWPDWAYAGPDGTFGNRWDDPAGSYRVLYASSTRLGAFVETLAPFRVDLAVIAGLQEIDAPEEPVASSVLPRRWLAGRVIGEASLDGSFVDIGDADTLATIRAELAARAIHYGLSDVDAAAIRLHAPRRFTQEIRASSTSGTSKTEAVPASDIGLVSVISSSTGRSSSPRPRPSCRVRRACLRRSHLTLLISSAPWSCSA